jgi:DNA-binding winged helix-turn-helix (wHTH) protein/formylglycine-generating enzyme required for sulfatase activity/dienelactone hydrolase
VTATKPFVFRFADIEVRERELSLVKAGEVWPVEPKAFRLLLYMLRNPQRVVSKDELLNEVWGDATVTESSLTGAIFKLRRLLGDDGQERRYIETVATVGYRFRCSVEVAEELLGMPAANDHLAASDEVEIATAAQPMSSGSSSAQGMPRRLVAGSAVILIAILGGWFWRESSHRRWARQTAMPEVVRLLDAGKFPQAAALALKAREVLPRDPTIDRLWMRTTGEVSIATTPAGAEVSIRPYRGDPNAWQSLGLTPIKNLRLPRDDYVWRLVKPGFATELFIASPPGELPVGDLWIVDWILTLHSAQAIPPEMVVVAGDEVGLTFPLGGAQSTKLDDFLIDRHEVTNEEYKRFVEAGGYTRREFWKQPFVLNGRSISWEVAMARFRDATGRPGPATWEAGGFPNGREKHPVAGVSWFEAAAYAEFAGKSLPTAYHWTLASQADGNTPLIAAGSNFRGDGTQPVGAITALSGFGTTDMAGNVKEWCLNETRDGKRLILGGGFGEPDYMFNFTDAQSPWERRANFGFRSVKLSSPPSPDATARVETSIRDFRHEKPVTNDVFRTYAARYSYASGPLNAKVDETVATESGSRARISFDAAYGRERVTAYLFLPRNASAPYQTVVYFPGAMATLEDKLDLSAVEDSNDFILKSGRALIVPIYKGTYQRRDGYVPGHNPPGFFLDHVIAWRRDLGRTIDYLETRKDIDCTRLVYSGFSLGAADAAILLALEKRFKAAVLLSGGFHLQQSYYLPEADEINFVGHVSTPVLMLNGRYDDTFPLEPSQRPFFQLLGTAPKDKKYVIYEGGHGVFPRPAAVTECLDWLDRYLGPVRR